MTIAPAPLESGRDFLGYGRDKPAPRWPGDARVAVSFVVNFEEGAEFSVADGDDRNEAIYEVEHRVVGMPDPDAGDAEQAHRVGPPEHAAMVA